MVYTVLRDNDWEIVMPKQPKQSFQPDKEVEPKPLGVGAKKATEEAAAGGGGAAAAGASQPPGGGAAAAPASLASKFQGFFSKLFTEITLAAAMDKVFKTNVVTTRGELGRYQVDLIDQIITLSYPIGQNRLPAITNNLKLALQQVGYKGGVDHPELITDILKLENVQAKLIDRGGVMTIDKEGIESLIRSLNQQMKGPPPPYARAVDS
jgi:hypothetical protein